FWGNEEVNSGGGVWYPPAVDADSGMTFWGTGNPAPFPGIVDFPNAESRPGPNLYTNSIVALQGASGDLEWFKQIKPRDLFDLDFQTPRILATIEGEDGAREIVIGSGKLGYVVAFDTESGDILWSTRVGEHENDELARVPEGETIRVFPGVLGGVETPMALAEDVLYVPVLDLPTPYTADGHGAEDGTEAVTNAEAETDFSKAKSHVAALELHTGRVLWKSDEFDEALFSGVTVVNDLLLAATYDGTMYALERETGEKVWSEQAPAGINAWPSVAGDTIVWPAGVGQKPRLVALSLSAGGA
ncbi:MAG TPA: PQQ-binding-like beta-propeller repeat protein, partial [Actinomycetota bacterium]|nr:PQQ-binding-like beta-propeller repeat protein [Actinomycetota bacterium]